MLSTDWNFDFSSLPGWENRERNPYIYDEFYEVEGSDMLCCIYSIAEVSMGNYLGFLAILGGKKEPKLFLNIANGFCFCNNFSASEDGRFVFLQPSIYNKDDLSVHRPILIIDMLETTFSFLITDNVNPNYKIVETDRCRFKVVPDSAQKDDAQLNALSQLTIQANKLERYDLSMIEALPKMLKSKRKQNS